MHVACVFISLKQERIWSGLHYSQLGRAKADLGTDMRATSDLEVCHFGLRESVETRGQLRRLLSLGALCSF